MFPLLKMIHRSEFPIDEQNSGPPLNQTVVTDVDLEAVVGDEGIKDSRAVVTTS